MNAVDMNFVRTKMSEWARQPKLDAAELQFAAAMARMAIEHLTGRDKPVIEAIFALFTPAVVIVPASRRGRPIGRWQAQASRIPADQHREFLGALTGAVIASERGRNDIR